MNSIDIKVQPHWLTAGLSGKELSLLLLLSEMSSDSGLTPQIKQERLADALDLSTSHIAQLFGHLKRKGVLEVEVKGNARAGEGTVYRLL